MRHASVFYPIIWVVFAAVYPKVKEQHINTISNKYGAVKVERDGRLVIGHFSGQLNASLINAFTQHLSQQADLNPNNPWVYVSHSPDTLAATPEAERALLALGAQMLSQGCRRFAYVLKSSIAIDQMKKIRSKFNTKPELEEILFDNLKDAKAFALGYFSEN